MSVTVIERKNHFGLFISPRSVCDTEENSVISQKRGIGIKNECDVLVNISCMLQNLKVKLKHCR